MKNILNRYLNSYWFYGLLAFLIGLTPLLWFNGYPIAGEEYYAVDYAKWGKLFQDSWFSQVNFGEFSILQAFTLQRVFFEVLTYIGISKYSSLVMWHVVLWVISSVGFYLLAYYIFVVQKSVHKVGGELLLLGTLLYTYSPYFLNISPFLTPPKLVFTIMPFILILLAQISFYPQKWFLYTLLLNLVMWLGSPIFVNLPSGTAVLMVIVLFFGYFLINNRQSWRVYLKALSLFVTIFVIINSWWLVPVYLSIAKSAGSIKSQTSEFVTINNTNTADTLSMLGSWAFREGIYGTDYDYFPYNGLYDSFPLVVIRFVPFVLLVISIYIIKEKDNYSVFLYIIFFSFLFLAKGVSAPFGRIYLTLFNHLPFFWIFREPYAKFMPIVVTVLPLLILPGLAYITQRLKVRRLIFFLLGGFFVWLGFPYLSSSIVWDVNDGSIRSYIIKPSEDWKKLIASWKPGSGYYQLFPSEGLVDRYMWPSGFSGNPYLMYTNAKTINSQGGYSQNEELRKVTRYLQTLLISQPSRYISESQEYGLSGIILQNDVRSSSQVAEYIKRLENSYASKLGFSTDTVKTYEFTKDPSPFTLIASNNVVNITSAKYSDYLMTKSAVSSSLRTLKIGQPTEQSDIIRLSPQSFPIGTNALVYPMPNSFPGQATLYLVGDTSNVKNVKLDGKDIPVQPDELGAKEFTFSTTAECCKDVTLGLSNIPITETTLSTKEVYKIDRTSSDMASSKQLDSLDIMPDTDSVYLVPLTNLNPELTNVVSIETASNRVLPMGLSVVYVDDATQTTRFILSYTIEDVSKKTSFLYNVFDQEYMGKNPPGKYFLAFYTLRLLKEEQEVTYPSGSSFSVKSVKIQQLNFPELFIMRGKYDTTPSPQVNYNSRSDYLYQLDVTDIKPGDYYLQFKNTYNPNWRLVSASPGTSQIKLLIKAFKAPEPVNFEHYSNGWVLNSGGKYTLVFWPALLTNLLTLVSFISVGCVCVHVFFTVTKRC